MNLFRIPEPPQTMRHLGNVTDETKTHARNNQKLRKQEQQDLEEGYTWQRTAGKPGVLEWPLKMGVARAEKRDRFWRAIGEMRRNPKSA
jgi:hypothetical protein